MARSYPISPQDSAVGGGPEAAPRRRRLRLPEGLPSLAGGRRRRAFRLLWFAALAATVLGLFGSVYDEYRTMVKPRAAFAEFGLRYTIPSPLRLHVEPGGPAYRAGIAAGDAIVAIDGTPVAEEARPGEVAGLLEAAGDSVLLRVRSFDDSVSEHRLTRSDEAARRYDETLRYSLFMAANALSTLLLMGVGLILFRRRPDDPVAATLSLAFLLLAGGAAAPMVLAKVAILSEGVSVLIFWLLMSLAIGALAAALFAFPSGRFEPRWTRWAVPTLPILSLFWIPPLVLGPIALAQRYRSGDNSIERQQLKWVVFGFAVGALLILACIPVGVAWANDPGFARTAAVLVYLLTVAGFSLFGVGLLVSLLRYRLYDADAVISRSAAYAVLMVIIATIWAGMKTAIEKGFESSFGETSGAVAAGCLVAFGAVLGKPAFDRVHRWTESRFHKAIVHIRRDLPLCVGDMRETAALNEILQEVLARIVTNVNAVRAAAVLKGPSSCEASAVRDVDRAEVEAWCEAWQPEPGTAALECDRGDPFFPLRLKLRLNEASAEPVGWILLGPRPDGSFYGRDEQEALAEAADPIARAVRIVRLREAREAELLGAIEALNRRLASIEEGRGKLRRPSVARGLEAGHG